MGILSNLDIEKNIDDRESSKKSNKPVISNKDYKTFRNKYKSNSSRRPIEPKGWDSEIKDEEELEH